MSTLWVLFTTMDGDELFGDNLPDIPRVGELVTLCNSTYRVASVDWDFGENDDGPRQVVYVRLKL